jgi:hypothetical protein
MSAGKYSPTVRNKKFIPTESDGLHDAEGYDMYGYNSDGVDREGKTPWDHDRAALREYLTDMGRYEEAEQI